MRRYCMLLALALGGLFGCSDRSTTSPAQEKPRMSVDPGSPVFAALRRGDLNHLRSVLEAGTDPNVLNDAGMTPLHSAVIHGPEFVSLLLEHGADPNVSAEPVGTALNLAASWRELECLPPLLEAGADPNARDDRSRTPLNSLAGAATDEVGTYIDLLVEAGADLEARDETGRTPLFRALWTDNAPAALALLDAGANVGATDDAGTPILVAAVRFGSHEATAAVLKKIAGASSDHEAALDAADEMGRTPLHVAVNEPELVGLLLKAGADPTAKDSWGRTPLTWAEEVGTDEAAEILREAGEILREAGDKASGSS